MLVIIAFLPVKEKIQFVPLWIHVPQLSMNETILKHIISLEWTTRL